MPPHNSKLGIPILFDIPQNMRLIIPWGFGINPVTISPILILVTCGIIYSTTIIIKRAEPVAHAYLIYRPDGLEEALS